MAADPARWLFVLVAGPPAVGKSTIATPLAAELGLAVIARDAIKRALMEALGRPTSVDESRALGRAAVLAMLAVASSSPGAVLDSTFYDYTVPLLEALPGALVEVRCVAPREVVEARYIARTGTRDPGYFDAHRPFAELWDAHLASLGVGPVLEVDTTGDVDIKALAARVLKAHETSIAGLPARAAISIGLSAQAPRRGTRQRAGKRRAG